MPSHKVLASWYQQLAQSLEAGVPLAEAIGLCQGPPEAGRALMAGDILAGKPLDEVLREAPGWLPRQDRLYISAAARTGRLPQTFENMAERHSQVGANQMKAVLSLIYPLGIFHFGVLILPIVGMVDFEEGFQFSIGTYLSSVLGMLVPLWLVLGGVFYLAKSDSPLLPRLLRIIPILRGYSRAQSLADFAYALGTFLDAGTPISKAWKGAALVANDRELTAATKKLEPTFAREEDPADQLKSLKAFPTNFIALYQSGAKSGQLEKNMLTFARLSQQTANARMTMAAVVYPTILFLIVVVFIVINIFKMYSGYLNALTDMMK